jgi:bifunctional non-homologous end joining protein LigD
MSGQGQIGSHARQTYAVGVGVSTPRTIAPMRAILTTRLPPDDANWGYEIKWDGMRAVAFVAEGVLRLQTANLLDATERFPELAPLAAAVAPHDAVLDGEIVTFNERGLPDFGLLQPRMQARHADAARRGADTRPAFYVLFDLLELDGDDLTALPYETRRERLVDLVPPGSHWKVSEGWVGGGADLLDVIATRGLEGLIAKRLGSRYEAGRRSRSWLKLKVRRGQELVVGGWLPGEGSRSTHFGALLVGYHDPEADGSPLRYAGRVGTGFGEGELVRLLGLFEGIGQDRCPFDPPPPRPVTKVARWVRPEVVVAVEFAEWTRDGILRHPAYVGQRLDKDADEVVREEC